MVRQDEEGRRQRCSTACTDGDCGRHLLLVASGEHSRAQRADKPISRAQPRACGATLMRACCPSMHIDAACVRTGEMAGSELWR